MRKLITLIVLAMIIPANASAHLLKPFDSDSHKSVKREYAHISYVCHHGTGAPKRAHCKAVPWIKRLVKETKPAPSLSYWIGRQIYAATQIGLHAALDPWPNCPDPIFNGSSWQATVNCENNGSWYDSPGYYRCGLQFDPMWERKYGQLCPY